MAQLNSRSRRTRSLPQSQRMMRRYASEAYLPSLPMAGFGRRIVRVPVGLGS